MHFGRPSGPLAQSWPMFGSPWQRRDRPIQPIMTHIRQDWGWKGKGEPVRARKGKSGQVRADTVGAVQYRAEISTLAVLLRSALPGYDHHPQGISVSSQRQHTH